jgi:2-dehydro-3-deoxyglucarate aldolase
VTNPYQAFPNSFKADLVAGKKLIGCWVSLSNHISTELLGVCGFDWLLLDAEHSPNDVLNLIPQLMALKDSPSAPIARPPVNDTALIKRYLDAGFQNFLIPMVDTAEQARAAVGATRYPPQGVRGVATSHRGNRYGAEVDYFSKANDNITVIAQIETRQAVAAAAEIAAVPGVDCVFIGPSDLAANYGHLGKPTHPEVQAAIAEVVQVVRKAGKPLGILTTVEADARRYIDMGISFVGVGTDVGLLRLQAQALAERFKT